MKLDIEVIKERLASVVVWAAVYPATSELNVFLNQDIPALISEIRRLREALGGVVHFHYGKCQRWKDGDDCFKWRHGMGNRICSVCQAVEALNPKETK